MFEDLLGKETRSDKAASAPRRCPYCGSLNVRAKSLSHDLNDRPIRRMECKFCKKDYDILYNEDMTIHSIDLKE